MLVRTETTIVEHAQRPTFRWALMREATRRYLEADPSSANFRRFKVLQRALLERQTVDLAQSRAFWACARRVMSEYALARTARILGATP